MARRRLFFLLASTGMAAVAGVLLAATISVKSGVVEQISPDGKTITVKFRNSDESTELSVAGEIDVLLDGKHVELTTIKPGMSVTVQIDGKVAQRIIAHADAPKPTTKPTRSKSTTKTTTTKKTTKTVRKSKSSSKKVESEPNALDMLPVATTPLAGLKNPPGKGGGGGGAWPCFLGPNRDNQSQETGLLKEWPEGGPKLAWPAPTTGLGQGYSNVSVANGTVYTMGTPDSQEAVLAIDLEKGKPKWSVPTGGDVFRDDQGNGPRSTPTIDGEFLYALGARGDLVCVDAAKQTVRWHKNLMQDFGSPGVRWGFSESVLLDNNRLICTPGAPGAVMVALNKLDGTLVWKCAVPAGNPAPGYASPLVADVAGTRQYITYTAAGVIGVRASDGQFLWGNNSTANTPANCTTPLLIRDYLFVSSAYNAGATLLQLAQGENGGVQANVMYHTRFMNSHFGGMVCVGGNVYGANGDVLTCFNLERQAIAWQNRSVGKCTLTYAEGNLYVRGDNGPVALVEATPDGYHDKGHFSPPTSGNGRAWAYPVVAAGRLFLRDEDGLLCYSLREGK
ncbi:MAG TPA: PQQ-binding-like beta-propeller repeat protein [Planctomycetaceae bacterium]|nr:PQQ-binding-like beta-propeller repeat protein [Planctomycetaceae bacterium]